MSMYRTITVTAALIGSVSVQASLVADTISISPSIESEISVTANLTDSVIAADADLHESTITVSPVWAIPVASYTTDVDYYTGPYEYTPTQETQTVSIQAKMATQDITINSIPSNYGLITWDGTVLTVS